MFIYEFLLHFILLVKPQQNGYSMALPATLKMPYPVLSRSSERRPQFYRFYLSRISPLKAVQVVMVIPVGIKEELERSLRVVAKDNGFGLWKIETSNKEPEGLCVPKDFLKHMEDEFRNPPEPPEKMEHFEPSITDKAPEISLFFDRYVREAVEALAGVTAGRIGKKHIERNLLNAVFKLQNISYAGELRKLVTKHLMDKDDDYEFVGNTFSTLWLECELGMNYANLLKIFEPPLYNIFAEREKPYRDHYFHQFHVFLLGLYIIDKLRGRFPDDIDRLWLITSSLHDIAYPLQLYDSWSQEFFETSLGIPSVGVSDIKSSFVNGSLLSGLGCIVNELCKSHFGEQLKGNWLQKERPLVRFFHDIITKRKHHCVLSSLFLLKHAQSCNSDLMDTLFVPSSLAITLQHEVVWKSLPPERRLKSLKFDNDPLVFLLMFCDSVQEWGKPKAYEEVMAEAGQEIFLLDEYKVTDSGCSVIIKTPYLSTTHDRFKEKELKNLEGFLQSSSEAQFKIILKDKSGAIREYPMTGPVKGSRSFQSSFP